MSVVRPFSVPHATAATVFEDLARQSLLARIVELVSRFEGGQASLLAAAGGRASGRRFRCAASRVRRSHLILVRVAPKPGVWSH